MKALHRLLRRIPVRYRRVYYDVISAGIFIWGLWRVSEGDVEQFVLATLGAVGAQIPSANTAPTPPTDAG